MTVTRVILIEGTVNLLVMLAKLVVGLMTQSTVILADALHSFTDMANNIIAYTVARVAAKPADASHPYGHQKFEYLAVFVLAILLVVVAIEILLHAIGRFGQPVEQSELGLWIMLSVLVVNIVLSRWQHQMAKKLKSPLLEADADHTFADVLTSVAVIAGWQLSAYGWYVLDTIFCIGISLFVTRLAWQLFKRALPTLTDQQIDEDDVSIEHLNGLLVEFPQITRIRALRTRRMGEQTLADLALQVTPSLSVAEAHYLAHRFEDRVKSAGLLDDIVIHIEPAESVQNANL